MNAYTEEQLAEYREAFNLLDKNGDGAISAMELNRVMKSLGINFSELDLQEVLQEIDMDGNGSIDFNSFLKLMTRQISSDDKDRDIKEAFKVFDKNGDGLISSAELNEVMTSLGEKLSERELLEIIKGADFDGDGKIGYEDFVKLIKGK